MSPESPLDPEPGPEVLQLAAELDEIAEVLRYYLAQSPAWADGSCCAEDMTHEDEFPGLPFTEPLVTLALQPNMMLSHAQDHLVAAAAIVRTRHTIIALLTVMRPLLLACGWLDYMLPPKVDVRERVRRQINVMLLFTTESMNLVQSGPHLVLLEKRRKDLMAAARAAKFGTISAPERRKTADHWLPWHVGVKPPSDMGLMSALIGTDDTGRDVGRDLYRLMSAASHAQQHAIYPLLRADLAVPGGPGYAMAPIGIDGRTLVTWTYSMTAVLDHALQLACGYYGWIALRWNSIARPKIAKWRAQAIQAASDR